MIFGGVVGTALILHPDSKLPNGWNPMRPLHVDDAVTPLTTWKLSRAVADPEICQQTLAGVTSFVPQGEVTNDNPACGIDNSVMVTGLGLARIGPVQTSCAVALRTAMWERHGLRPAARAILGTDVTAIDDIGSYNCRAMRLANGETGRMSSHATASALDVAGFRFADGTRLRLIADWDDPGPKGAFLKAARDSACDWFRVTLSPDYNSLHSDHFHLQSTGWGLCR